MLPGNIGVPTFRATCSRSVELAYANVLAMPMHTAIPVGKDTVKIGKTEEEDLQS